MPLKARTPPEVEPDKVPDSVFEPSGVVAIAVVQPLSENADRVTVVVVFTVLPFTS